MAAKSNYLAAALLNHVFGHSPYTAPTTYYLCLVKSAVLPAQTGSTIVEVTYTGYARVALTTASFAAVAGQTESNGGTISFPQCGATGDTAVGWALCDASAGGNLLYYGLLPTSVSISSGLTPTLAAGTLTVTES